VTVIVLRQTFKHWVWVYASGDCFEWDCDV